MSRQSEWQKRMKRDGRCTKCGGVPLHTSDLCEECAYERRRRRREYARGRNDSKTRYKGALSYNQEIFRGDDKNEGWLFNQRRHKVAKLRSWRGKPTVLRTFRIPVDVSEGMDKIVKFVRVDGAPKYESLTHLLAIALDGLISRERRVLEEQGISWEHVNVKQKKKG